MSDRDKKIIMFVLIIMVTVLPYVFYIKDTKIQTQTVQTNVDALQARYDELYAMDQNRDFYIEETERFHEERDTIIASFPAGIRNDNFSMFLLQTEYSSDVVVNEETDEIELQYPIRFDTVSFGTNIETPISTEDMDTGYVALSNVSGLTYSCYYDGLKYLLEYLMEYDDPMIYTTIDMSMDSETGIVSGSMMLSQYAIAGADRVLPDVEFTIEVGGEDVNVDLDDNELRGMEETEENEGGIFGPVGAGMEEEEEEAVPAEGEAEAVEE